MFFCLNKNFSELSKEILFNSEVNFHTGIVRDETNKSIYRRSADGVQVNVEDWFPGYPSSEDDHNFLTWWKLKTQDENTVWNLPDYTYFFICEF